jgi:formate dehydrogenase subunit gamma
MATNRHAVLRTEVPSDQIMRYTWVERLCHWTTAATYLYCAVGGLALFSPYTFWMVFLLGGGPTARFWHPFVGFGFVAAIFWMNAMWAADFKMIPEDKEWNRKIKYYITNQDEKLPPQARFDSGQKVFFWTMLSMSILLPLSGIVMWFPELMPRSFHWILPLVVFVHEGAALLTFGLVIIHAYMGTVIVPGSWRAITVGYVSRGWGMLHHPLWYKKVTEQEPSK